MRKDIDELTDYQKAVITAAGQIYAAVIIVRKNDEFDIGEVITESIDDAYTLVGQVIDGTQK